MYVSCSEFEGRVNALNLHDVYNITGKNTFFIPVDTGINHFIEWAVRVKPVLLTVCPHQDCLKPEKPTESIVSINTSKLKYSNILNGNHRKPVDVPKLCHLLRIRDNKTVIDKQVIHGHVVPGKVLFTRTVKDSRDEYESLAFTDNLKVFISMENVSSSDNEDQYYVKSRTIASDVAHMKGTALARIVKGNIPIKNGVAHLIDRPLMLVATNVLAILQRTAQLSMFYDLIKNHNADLKNMMIVAKSLTVFAPSNEAFKKVNKRQLEQKKKYYTDWNGVRAKVIRPDLKCVNGVVHVIDKVMMMNRDVTVSGSAVPAASGLASLVATFFTVAFARALHH
ncbi:Fasciclin-1 [Portunus trituberculatus]|uniref:Fasciclin-1 n=1 Tax=Portunus trituberculatus TaxID=210409 RepID=A0A5B7CUT7_PORTR|nr:Fasciclin-1 [Portunus trituberculatus]